ncbi:6-phosphofructo-2-kinase/fructose-2,6-bisphosphatase [Panicum miliaceum]|uniref:6-phosphofructo-2-kinase/fructose-2, 6-bisphosphatase n=1 Tax=Panicum miliaceum TaxID=4540 RepID=A0A3L6RAL8_PANMI|nr:6-phosphofructo-2-kinase/fructose-2,6-bisphosphatase [Panicum miliaceum]
MGTSGSKSIDGVGAEAAGVGAAGGGGEAGEGAAAAEAWHGGAQLYVSLKMENAREDQRRPRPARLRLRAHHRLLGPRPRRTHARPPSASALFAAPLFSCRGNDAVAAFWF